MRERVKWRTDFDAELRWRGTSTVRRLEPISGIRHALAFCCYGRSGPWSRDHGLRRQAFSRLEYPSGGGPGYEHCSRFDRSSAQGRRASA